ncbi:NUDIX hydrolase [Candidatus Gracilibacteria bacterium]|nr:NUDIX hydrolase [Candidatus Gracilibacteria bacterium]NUJ99056.1 NUDIX hydrolase [Candidatus Gracilibacteria bacterium]
MIFAEIPQDFNPKMEVSSCLIKCKDEYLFLLRHPNKPQGNTWGLPAGKLENNEDMFLACKRETFEETGFSLERENIKFYKSFPIRYKEYDFWYHTFLYEIDEKFDVKIDPVSHTDFIWLSLDEMIQKDNLIHDLDGVIEYIKKSS